MNPKQQTLNDETLYRMVDNQLDESSYREALRLAEEKPEGWREIALAFLENQALENDLDGIQLDTSLIESSLHESSLPESHLASSPAERVIHPDSEPNVDDAESKPPARPFSLEQSIATRKRQQVWIAFAGLAACFLITISTIAYLQKQPAHSGTDGSFVEAGQSGQTPSDDSGFIQLVGNRDGESVRAPVIDHTQFDPELAKNDFQQLTPQIQAMLDQTGLKANERTHVVPIRDKAGNQIILPLKEIELLPKQWEDYQ